MRHQKTNEGTGIAHIELNGTRVFGRTADHLFDNKALPPQLHEEIRRHLQEMLESSIPHRTIIRRLTDDNDLGSFIAPFTNHSGAILFKGCDRAMLIKTCHTIMRNITQCLSLPISITISDRMNSLLKAEA